MPFYLLLPFFAAAGYTVSSLFFKQAYARGATSTQAFHWANVIGMMMLSPVFFLGDGMELGDLWRPAFIGALIYAGAWATFVAIRLGDVSLVTPLLGTKVLFVAFATPLLSAQQLSWQLWLGAALTAGGIFLTGYKDFLKGHTSLAAILFCMGSCFFFAVSDVLLQNWAPQFGGMSFLGVLALVIGLFSLMQAAGTGLRAVVAVPKPALPGVIWGGIILAIQGIAMGIALGFFNDAAGVNVVYGSRGIWSLAVVWFAGRLFGNAERTDSRDAMGLRLMGCLLVTAAIILVLWQ